MWHEARRQEKLVRARMVDNAKRNERRKQFYESVRKEPEGFMQLHGQKMPIRLDPSVAEAAESPNTMRKWQGDASVLIDRFDVRVYLDHIPEALPKHKKKAILKDDVIELQCEYERWRILVLNEFRKVSEKQFLKEIAQKEFWPSQQSYSHQLSNATYKNEAEKKKKFADKRAAIAFSYANSETVKNSSHGDQQQTENSSEDEDFDEPEEIDANIDPEVLTAEQASELNRIGAQHQITSGAFFQLLSLDRREQTSTAQIKEIDKAKLALTGRHAKADRALLKRRRATILGNLGSSTQNDEEATTSLLSFLAAANKANLDDKSSSSDSGEEFVRTEFITCIGGEEEKAKKNGEKRRLNGNDEEEDVVKTAVVQGPVLPNREYRRLLELSRRRSVSPENVWDQQHRGRKGSRHYSRSPVRRRTRSCSKDRSLRDSASIRHSSTRKRRRSSSSSSANKKRGQRDGRKAQPTTRVATSSAREAKGTARSPVNRRSKSESSSSDPDTPLSVHSSMSESEKERIERENRKRRIRRTKRMVKAQHTFRPETVQEELDCRVEKAAKKLRSQMQRTLTNTAARLKEEEEQRAKETAKEKKRREEQLLEESRLLRKREREKRKAKEDKMRTTTRRRLRSSSSE